MTLSKNNKKKEADHAFGQAQILLRQTKKSIAIKRNDLKPRNENALSRPPPVQNPKMDDPDNVSYFSWGSDDSGPFSDLTGFGNVSKEAIIFKQYA